MTFDPKSVPQEVIDRTHEAIAKHGFEKVAQVMFELPDLKDATLFEKIGRDFFLAEQEWQTIADGLVAADHIIKK